MTGDWSAGGSPDGEAGPPDGTAHGGESADDDATPVAESPRAALVAALAVRRNLAAGLVVGAAFAAAVFVVFVAQPSATRFAPWYYLPLAVTAALAVATLVALALTLARAAWLVRRG